MPTLGEIRKILKLHLVKGTDADEEITDSDDDNVSNEEKDLKYSKEMDKQLLNFFSSSYQITPVETLDLNYEKGINDILRLIRVLNVNLSIPKNFDNITCLDSLDKKILNSLKSRDLSEHVKSSIDEQMESIQELVPPNLYSTVGLRSLLIKHVHYKRGMTELSQIGVNTKNSFPALRQFITNDILNFSLFERIEIEAERNLFYRRFYSLFKWPALMTLQDPAPELLNISEFLPLKRTIQIKRTYGRMSANETNENTKKIKPSNISKEVENPVTTKDITNTLKLTPVSNKSVLQDLMKNKTKKLFTLNKINENGQIRTVINEVKFDFAKGNNGRSSTSVQRSSLTDKIIEKTQLVDTSKVNCKTPELSLPKNDTKELLITSQNDTFSEGKVSSCVLVIKHISSDS